MNEKLESLARDCVGSEQEELYFCSNEEGNILAVFLFKRDALEWAGARDMYVEGPNGEEQESSWSAAPVSGNPESMRF